MNHDPTNPNPEPEIRNHKRGPNTPEGKKRVSMNALRHGLTARSPQALQSIAEQSGVDFDEILNKVRTHYWPVDQIEDMICKRMARCLWRLAQMEEMERRLFEIRAERTTPGASYEAVLKSERLVSLELHRCFRTLAGKREADNKKSPGNNLIPRSA